MDGLTCSTALSTAATYRRKTVPAQRTLSSAVHCHRVGIFPSKGLDIDWDLFPCVQGGGSAITDAWKETTNGDSKHPSRTCVRQGRSLSASRAALK